MVKATLSYDVLNRKEQKIKVRKAVLEDAADIQEITLQAFMQYSVYVGGSVNLPALREEWKDVADDILSKEVFIAFIGEKAVGSVRIEIMDDSTAYLSRFGVLPQFQNNGVGSELINAVDKMLMDMGVRRLYLHTAAKATSLICTYYKRGFYIDSTTKDRGYIRALLCKEYKSNAEVAIS